MCPEKIPEIRSPVQKLVGEHGDPRGGIHNMYNHLLKLYIFFLHVVPLFCLLKEIRPSAAVRPSGRTAADPPALPFHSENPAQLPGSFLPD